MLYTLIGLLVLFCLYFFIVRPWSLNWGAKKEEVNSIFPGDEVVKKPDFYATRGITINAGAEEIWKWIIQIGSKRAGWYSIDWMDNAGIPSSEKILQEFQNICEGQFIPFTPDQKNGMWVKEYKENDYILWTDKKEKATWLWKIIPDNGSSRLLTRLRTKYVWNSIWIIYYLIYDVGDIVMMSKCMKGIKRRAEKTGN
jgi:hypothetical protein